MKNTQKKWMLFVITSIVTFLGIGYTLLKGTEAVLPTETILAEMGLEDENFYKCLIDAYNEITEIDKGYTEVITDEELDTITIVNCNGLQKNNNEKISNTTGLSKLTNLEILDLSFNKIESIDVSNNKELKELLISSNNLEELDISSNTSLEKLDASNNNLTQLNIIDSSKLIHININNNNFVQVDGYKYKSNNIYIYDSNLIYYHEVKENLTTVDDNVSYEAYKIISTDEAENADEEKATDNTELPVIIRVYYKLNSENIELAHFYLYNDFDYYFDESISIDEENSIVGNINPETTVNEFKNMININGNKNINIEILDSDGNQIENEETIIKTGNKVKISLNETESDTFTISVNGDINSDGIFDMNDVLEEARYLINKDLIILKETITSADYDKNNIININDVIKMFKHISKNGDNNE